MATVGQVKDEESWAGVSQKRGGGVQEQRSMIRKASRLEELKNERQTTSRIGDLEERSRSKNKRRGRKE